MSYIQGITLDQIPLKKLDAKKGNAPNKNIPAPKKGEPAYLKYARNRVVSSK